MVRKSMKMLAVALIAAFALSSMAEASTPKKTRHRPKHSSRVASGAAVTTTKKPAPKKPAAAKAGTPAKSTSAAKKPAAKKTTAKRRPTTKPR
jgi:hypothetical protein